MDKLTMLEEAELEEVKEKRAKFNADLIDVGNVWGHSIVADEGKKAAMAMLSTKNGLYAKIPLVCKGEGCPYKET